MEKKANKQANINTGDEPCSSKYTRFSTGHVDAMDKSIYICFFCSDLYLSDEDYREAATEKIDVQVKRCALDLQLL